ncbi:MAG: hypothetical protein H6601_00255 [Flavobacteriales bacterium]|nr:hypothetical protein [Flavobacteriales bacterium]
MRFILALILFPVLSFAQHKSVSYEMMNEIGTFQLVSLTFSHELDNTEGITYVLSKHDEHFDTVYQIDQFLNGWVALSNDGQTVAQLISEKSKEPLDNCVLSMYRNGKLFDTAKLDRLVHYELLAARTRNRLPKSGWLRNDSIYHQMATHPFYVTDDKLFLSFDNPKLAVFDLNQMFHIYTGNGANHFLQNYYSLPNAPRRTEFDSEEYFPNEFPKTQKGEVFVDALSKELEFEKAIPEEAKFRAEVEFKLNIDGSFELREAVIYNIGTNEKDEELSTKLKTFAQGLKLDTSLLPPNHPSWIFSQIFWLK